MGAAEGFGLHDDVWGSSRDRSAATLHVEHLDQQRRPPCRLGRQGGEGGHFGELQSQGAVSEVDPGELAGPVDPAPLLLEAHGIDIEVGHLQEEFCLTDEDDRELVSGFRASH